MRGRCSTIHSTGVVFPEWGSPLISLEARAGFGAVGQDPSGAKMYETDPYAIATAVQCVSLFAFPLCTWIILQCSVVDCITWNKLRKAAKVLVRPRGRVKPGELGASALGIEARSRGHARCANHLHSRPGCGDRQSLKLYCVCGPRPHDFERTYFTLVQFITCTDPDHKMPSADAAMVGGLVGTLGRGWWSELSWPLTSRLTDRDQPGTRRRGEENTTVQATDSASAGHLGHLMDFGHLFLKWRRLNSYLAGFQSCSQSCLPNLAGCSPHVPEGQGAT